MSEDKSNKPNISHIEVETIPSAFYGGENPVVFEKKHKDINKKIEKKVASPIKKKVEVKKNVVDAPLLTQNKTPQVETSAQHAQLKQPKEKKGLLIGLLILGIVVFLGITIGIIYYLYFAPMSDVEPVIDITPSSEVSASIDFDNTITPEFIEDTIEEEVIEEPEEIVEIIPEPTELGLVKIVFPSTISSFGKDSDEDGLTDAEELILKTDGSISDTDQDGYNDMLELQNLYNPTGFAPIKIIESGLVQEYTNPLWEYRLYYPLSWNQAEVDNIGDRVLFSTISQQFIEVSVIKKQKDEAFTQWFGRYAQSENITNLIKQINRFDQSYYVRNDGLVAYIYTDEVVYVIVYKNDNDETIEYKNILSLMAQSFRSNKSITVDQIEQELAAPETSEIDIISTTTEDILVTPSTTINTVTSTDDVSVTSTSTEVITTSTTNDVL